MYKLEFYLYRKYLNTEKKKMFNKMFIFEVYRNIKSFICYFILGMSLEFKIYYFKALRKKMVICNLLNL